MNDESKNFSAGAKALINDAQRLGLTWDLRPATVGGTDPLQVTVDADSVLVNATSMVGALVTSSRVYVLLIPPSGVFVVGFNGNAFTSKLGVAQSLSQIGTVGTTTSATYANVPGNPTVTIVKNFPASLTNIAFMTSFSMFASVVNAGVGLGVNTNGGSGTDIDLMGFAINPAATHTHVSNHQLLANLDVGTYVFTLRWKRTASAATLQVDGGDWVSMLAEEVWAV